MSIISRLKRKQKSEGLSTAALADKLGVTRQGMNMWLRGDRTPNGRNLLKILKYLGDI